MAEKEHVITYRRCTNDQKIAVIGIIKNYYHSSTANNIVVLPVNANCIIYQ
ncbi:hypothetical protein HMPREF0204_12621 [Chryseobacterium gleum ATCC 35910]|uniref:Uncharacterized protein n=1 Tax=Chryseobacterium gleum ATCC 35910 TaxID=525257 RepID=A0ABP2IIN7_CHRGE|nr:hypothetical protein HMPREF0204_12621 [Chryseobacterium gleum ATCC 35910]